MRFRKEQVAITTIIEHMFHCFVVKEDHQDCASCGIGTMT